jgi:beta-mannosidase
VVDSERRRKLAYYPVRRAFQPVQVFCVRQGEEIVAVGCNDTQKPVTADLLLGTFAMASNEVRAEQRAVLEPNSATPLARFKAADLGEGGAYAVLDLDDGDRWQDVLLERTFGELTLAPSPYFQFSRSGEASEIVSDSFVWGTCIDLEGKPAADNAFTLVPGLPYRLKGEVDRTKLWCANQVLGR